MFLKIIRNYNTLKHLAYYDMLTGLLNRNWFYKNMNKLKYKYVYFIDINDLHKINKHGHAVGDEHIKKIILEIKISHYSLSLSHRNANLNKMHAQ